VLERVEAGVAGEESFGRVGPGVLFSVIDQSLMRRKRRNKSVAVPYKELGNTAGAHGTRQPRIPNVQNTVGLILSYGGRRGGVWWMRRTRMTQWEWQVFLEAGEGLLFAGPPVGSAN
jgi:hypothetical protein